MNIYFHLWTIKHSLRDSLISELLEVPAQGHACPSGTTITHIAYFCTPVSLPLNQLLKKGIVFASYPQQRSLVARVLGE